MLTGGKNDADLVGALQNGALDLAAEMLKKIHDTRDAGLRAAALHRLSLPDPILRSEVMGLSGMAYELAQLQGEMLSRLLGLQRRHAETVQRKVESALGLSDANAPSAALRGHGAGPDFRLAFRLKNSLGHDGLVDGSLEGDALTDAAGDRHLTRASLELPSVLPASGNLPAGAVTLLHLALHCPSAAPGARLQGRYTVRVGEAPALSLVVDLLVD